MRNGLGFFNAVLTIAVITLTLVWMVTAMTNDDLLWFLPTFAKRAETLTIYWDGTTYILRPNDPGYDEVMDAFAKSIARPAGFEWKVAFSEKNIQRYREEFRMLEVTFAHAVQVHTRHPFSKARTYLIPLDKTHSYWHRVFAFPGRMPYAQGPLNLRPEGFNAIYEAVEGAATAR